MADEHADMLGSEPSTPRMARNARFESVTEPTRPRAGRPLERDVHLFGDQHQLGALIPATRSLFGRGRIGENSTSSAPRHVFRDTSGNRRGVSGKIFRGRLSIFRPVAGAEPEKRNEAHRPAITRRPPSPRAHSSTICVR